MNSHFTSKQVSAWVAGQRTPAMEEHIRGCADCAAEVRRVVEPLNLFRECITAVSEQEMRTARFVPSEKQPVLAHPLGWRMALATAVLAMAAVMVHFRPTPHAAVPVTAPTIKISDEALLEQVQAETSRSVPETMEPLEKLMSGGRAE